MLAPGGLLVLRVSALDMLRSRHSAFACERQRFTRRAWLELARSCGIRVLRCTYANSLLLPVALAKFRLWEPLTRRPAESGVRPVAGWLDRLLYFPLALEVRLDTGRPESAPRSVPDPDRRKGACMKFPGSLSVFFPAYNDALSLPGLVARAFEVLERHVEDYEVIVVNDGSQDNTGEVLAESGAALRAQAARGHACGQPGLWRGAAQRFRRRHQGVRLLYGRRRPVRRERAARCC